MGRPEMSYWGARDLHLGVVGTAAPAFVRTPSRAEQAPFQRDLAAMPANSRHAASVPTASPAPAVPGERQVAPPQHFLQRLKLRGRQLPGIRSASPARPPATSPSMHSSSVPAQQFSAVTPPMSAFQLGGPAPLEWNGRGLSTLLCFKQLSW